MIRKKTRQSIVKRFFIAALLSLIQYNYTILILSSQPKKVHFYSIINIYICSKVLEDFYVLLYNIIINRKISEITM